MRRVPELSVAHFAYIVVTICDLSSAHTSHICNRMKFALRFLRYLSIAQYNISNYGTQKLLKFLYLFKEDDIMSKETKKGPDFEEKQPTPYLHDAPVNVSHPGKHQSGVGGPSDCNNNGIDDSKEGGRK